MTDTQTKISVITPVYNTESYIRECIDSILAQTFRNFEYILVDDCSPDNCPAICDEYAKKDNRIKVIHKNKNEGLPLARKSGFDFSSGNYILFIDSDDWIEPSMLEKLYNKAEDGNCDIVVCNMYNNFGTQQKEDSSPELYDKIGIIKRMLAYQKYSPSVCDKLISREIYNKIIFPVHGYIEDKVITIQVFFYTTNIGYIQDHLYHYRLNQTSISNSKKQAAKTLDEYNNIKLLITFLNDRKLIPLVDKELNYCVNTIKLSFLKEKELRRQAFNIFENFYPESTIDMKQDIYTRFYHKLFIWLALRKSPFTFVVIDVFLFIKKILLTIYKCIPGRKND